MAEFDYESEAISKRIMAASPHSAGEVHISTGRVALDASLAASDMIGICLLPKGCIPVDFTMKSGDLDTHASPTITVSIGISKAAKSDLAASTTIIADSAVPKTGGIDKPDATDVVLQGLRAKNVDRIIAGKVTAAGTTKAAGELMGELFYRAAESGEWSSTPSSIS